MDLLLVTGPGLEPTYASCLSKVFKGLEDRDSPVFLSLHLPLVARPRIAHAV